jgi:hypothetical protein
MPPAALIVPPATADLEDLPIPPAQQPFHAELRRGLEITGAGPARLDMLFRGIGRNPVRRLNLQESAGNEELPDGLHDPGTQV